MAEAPSFKLKIPPAVTQYLKPDAPRDARLIAAKGAVPMAPAVLVTALTYLLSDADEEIRITARGSLLEMPPMMVAGILKEPTHPKALDFFAHERVQDEKIIEPILLNPLTTDDTFIFLADQVCERHTTIIANNQVRLLRTPKIAETLKKNVNVLKSTIDTMVSFLRMSGVVIEGESAELTPQEIQTIIKESPDEAALPQVLTTENPPNQEVTEDKKKSIYQTILTLTVAQKVKLSLKGNKEARSILIKDSNKIVAAGVVKNPGISDGEIAAISQLRTIQDEVIRIIANVPDWTKNYNIQVNLANNPKTPFPIALKFVRNLHVGDLKKLVGNKNIPSQLSKIAKELFEKKRG